MRDELLKSFKLGLPLAVTQLASIAINTTDTVMLGWLGPDELAAGSLAFRLFIICFLACLGMTLSVGPILGQELGRRRYRNVRRTVRQGFWVAIAASVPLFILMWNGEAVFLALGQQPEISAKAGSYLRWSMWGLLPSICFIVLRQFVSAHQRTRSPLVVLSLGIPLNILGNYVLMYGKFGFPELGLVGIGLSTAISHVFMLAVQLGYCVTSRKFRRYYLLVRFWRPDWPRFREIVTLGYPISISVIAESGLFVAATLMVGIVEPSALAAHAVAMQCNAVSFMIPLGFSQAATVRTALARGKDDVAGIRRAAWSAMILAAVFAIIPVLVFGVFGRTVVGFYLDTDDASIQSIVDQAVMFLILVAGFACIEGVQVVALGSLRGLKDTKGPMRLTIFGYWVVGVPMAAVFAWGFDLGAYGVWYGVFIGLFVSTGCLIYRQHKTLSQL